MLKLKLPVYGIFVFVWSTLVYDFVTYWIRAKNGWLKKLGVLDYAGATSVHITSGFSALAYSICVGRRRTVNFRTAPRSINPPEVYMGTAMAWFGWFGFNAGSELAVNARAVNAVILSNLAASTGGLSWVLADMVRRRSRRILMSGFCNGVIAGLVAISPAAGYVAPYFSPIFGITGKFFVSF